MTRRLGPSVESSLLTVAVIGAVALVLSFVAVFPPSSGGSQAVAQSLAGPGTTDQSGDGTSAGSSAAGAPAGATGANGAAQGGAGAGAAAQQAAANGAGAASACTAAHNGGATDVGVTATSIKLAATIVTDGPGASFLAPEQIGLNAVVNKVNRSGGICGRRISLELNNDSWQASLGEQYIQNFVQGDKVFALASSDSEGLYAADSFIRSQGVPVVGTDGMLTQQYQNPWIWPVATSTIATMHVMAKSAYDRGARNFGLVFDDEYHFGVEGANAFDQAVKRLTGSDIPGFDASLKSCQQRFCGIEPAQSSYSSQASSFNQACYYNVNSTCDFIGYLLEPDTMLSWVANGRPADPRYGQGGAQPLFTTDFATNCRNFCQGMWVWTGYNPPVGSDSGLPGVAQYVNDVHRESSSVDALNQFLEGGYDGMELMVTALQKVGPNVTRANLKAVLDSMTYDSGLSAPLAWHGANHFANTASRAFAIHFGNQFDGFSDAGTGFIHDPWVGQDVPSRQ
jgi:ABC-type branched-subunit amino acid transport system substrate-binding protein